MSDELVLPHNVYQSDGYWQAAIANGARVIHLTGQAAWDDRGGVVGVGDLARQTEQAYRNVAQLLNDLGAGFEDVTRIKAYVVDWSVQKRAPFRAGAHRAAKGLGFDARKPTTVQGVAALSRPGLLVEIEATAILN